MQPDIVIDPEAVMVEFVGAPIALHAVLRVFQNVAVAHRAIVRVVFLSEADEFVLTARFECLQRLSIKAMQLHRWVSWITCRH